MSDDPEYDFGDRPGVPASEGETWGEAAARLRPDAMVEMACPNGHFELLVRGYHATRDGLDFLEDVALQSNPGPCPDCGADVNVKPDETVGKGRNHE